MKVHLLYANRDFEQERPLPPQVEDLTRDLGLKPLIDAMAQQDEFIADVVRRVLFASLPDASEIRFRQEVLQDCLGHPEVVRAIYGIPLEYAARKRSEWLWVRDANPSATLGSARRLLASSLDLMRRLRETADQNIDEFASAGFKQFFRTVQEELDDAYFSEAERHLELLDTSNGLLLSAKLGKGNEGIGYLLRKPNEDGGGWLRRMIANAKRPSYSFTLPPRDNRGAQALEEIRDRGVPRAASALAQAAGHVESFLGVLQWELAFYLGCLNLHETLTALRMPITFPDPQPEASRGLQCSDLCNVTLALTSEERPVGNELGMEDNELTIVTGPNTGGKTTFLRSIGLAQLMSQAGMFVSAKRFSANLTIGLFTHFKREEDRAMESGKFQEELVRMSEIVDQLRPDSLLLLNESFSTTNEREGSEIAAQVIDALLERGVQIYYVTHSFTLAERMIEARPNAVCHLLAERRQDGTRTFKMRAEPPQKSSGGTDLYFKLFGGSEEERRQAEEGVALNGGAQPPARSANRPKAN